MAAAPLARKLVARLIRLLEIPFELLQSQFPNYIFENIVYQIGNFASIASFGPGQSGLVQMDWNGNIVASYFNTDGSVRHISDAVVFNNKLYTGCPHLQNFIGAVPAPPELVKAFTVKKAAVEEQPKETAKPTQSYTPKDEPKKEAPKNAKRTAQAPPPTTATPKPTAKSNHIPKETVVKQNTAPKEAKPESGKAKLKREETPKAVPKQDEKPKVAPKVAGTKPIAPASQAEAKQEPKVDHRDAAPKLKAKAHNSGQPKPEVKNQQASEKPVKKTESKVKVSETNNAKSEQRAESVHSKSGKSHPGAPEPDVDRLNAEAKPAPEREASARREAAPEATPIDEHIPSDTAKPTKGTLKVIKKSGPQEIPNPIL